MKISVNYSRTVNLGNYESLKVEAGMEDVLIEDESWTEKYRKMWLIVEDEVRREVLRACGKKI